MKTRALHDSPRAMRLAALFATGKTQADAARILGVSRAAVSALAKRYDLTAPTGRNRRVAR